MEALGTKFEKQGDRSFCDNGTDPAIYAARTIVVLNQTIPHQSGRQQARAKNQRNPDNNFYSYLDFTYQDGTPQ